MAQVYLDGRLTGVGHITSCRPNELLAVEVFPRVGMVPIQYERFASNGEDCGVVLVWSRRRAAGIRGHPRESTAPGRTVTDSGRWQRDSTMVR